MSAALILRNNDMTRRAYFTCSVSGKDERRKLDCEKSVKKAGFLKMMNHFTLTSIATLFTINPRTQSSQIDGLVLEGCDF